MHLRSDPHFPCLSFYIFGIGVTILKQNCLKDSAQWVGAPHIPPSFFPPAPKASTLEMLILLGWNKEEGSLLENDYVWNRPRVWHPSDHFFNMYWNSDMSCRHSIFACACSTYTLVFEHCVSLKRIWTWKRTDHTSSALLLPLTATRTKCQSIFDAWHCTRYHRDQGWKDRSLLLESVYSTAPPAPLCLLRCI